MKLNLYRALSIKEYEEVSSNFPQLFFSNTPNDGKLEEVTYQNLVHFFGNPIDSKSNPGDSSSINYEWIVPFENNGKMEYFSIYDKNPKGALDSKTQNTEWYVMGVNPPDTFIDAVLFKVFHNSKHHEKE